jgi:hypothetical protein
MRWLPLSALVCLLIAAPAEAQIKSGQTSKASGLVSATLSWQGSEFGFVGTEPHLRIDRSGVTALDVDLARQCQLCNGVAAPDEALHLVDLDDDAEPEVLVDLYTGGAHCCATTLIWFFDGANYSRRVMSLGNQGYRRRDLDADGFPELITADDRFSYEFTAFAFSWSPPLIYNWRDHGLLDVTRNFPSRIRADLAEIRRLLPRARRDGDPRGLVAGYVADQYLLGRGDAARAYLRAARRRGDLRAIPKGDKTWPSGRGFAPALLRFLRKHGYR